MNIVEINKSYNPSSNNNLGPSFNNNFNSIKKTKRINNIYRTNIINDQPFGEDYLSYEKYAHALSFITSSEHIELPLTVGISSSWGTGKSFLLQKIENEFRDKKDKNVVFVNFNAWEYSGADVLWAGLIKNIYEEVELKFTPFRTRFFKHFIYPFRETNNNRLTFYHIFFWILRIFLLIISSFYLFGNFSSKTEIYMNQSNIYNVPNYSVSNQLINNISFIIPVGTLFGISIISVFPYLIKIIISLLRNQGKETEKSAKDIENKVGFMANVKDELEITCDFMNLHDYKFVIFIDDLDRCPPKKIVETLDAIMLLLSNKSCPFLTFISIEPNIIVKSIEASYLKKKINCLNGHLYLDKLIQIPFNIPMPSPKTKNQMIDILMRDKVEILEQIYKKILVFLDKYKLYEYTNIKIPSKINYKSKLNFIHQIYKFLFSKFGKLQNNNGNKNGNNKNGNNKNSVNMCFFIDKTITFIDNKIDENDNILGKIKELEEIINYENENYTNLKENLFSNNLKKLVNCDIKFLREKIKNNSINDEEIIFYGYELAKQNKIIDLFEFSQYLKSFIEKHSFWSPYKIPLNELSYKIEDILENQNMIDIQDKIVKSFSDEEIVYFHKISKFFDGNCRRNKRIVNIYSLSRYLMGRKIQGWFHNKRVNKIILTKMIKLIVLTEQWSYKISWIFKKIEDMRISLDKLNQTDDKQTDSKTWVKYYGNTNIIDILEMIPKNMFYHEKLLNLSMMDYNSKIFKLFCEQKPFITIDTIYLLIPFLFNLNLNIKNEISKIYFG